MKKIAVMGIAFASVFALAACGNSTKSGAATSYSYVYQTDPNTLDYTNSNRASTSDVIAIWLMDFWKMINTEILCPHWLKIGQYQKTA